MAKVPKNLDGVDSAAASASFVERVDAAIARLAEAQAEVKEARRALKDLQEARLRSFFG